jgi:hypothetical protein
MNEAQYQARVILIRCRKEVFEEWQYAMKHGEPWNELAASFNMLTNAIRRMGQ